MKIVLAVTGSISAYKSYDILRALTKKGHEVKVVLSRGALKFIRSETFHYLGASAVYTSNDDFNLEKRINSVLHIDLKNWLDKLVIAPASANTIANLANGQADDLLSSLFLSILDKDILIFPAMNTNMLEHPFTQKNIKTLDQLSHTFIHPTIDGLLACGDKGPGKLPEVETIAEFIHNFSRLRKNYSNVLITTGSTISPLDPVRYLTNPASGKTGFELSSAYLQAGHKVTLIYGPQAQFNTQALAHHPNLTLIKVNTTEDMFCEVDKIFSQCDIYISSAAINDIEFSQETNKIKKSIKKEKNETALEFSWARDILKSMLEKREKQIMIGFAAESKLENDLFSKKWKSKPVDLLIGNLVSNGFSQKESDKVGFSQNENTYYFVKDGEVSESMKLSKKELSSKILNFTENFHA